MLLLSINNWREIRKKIYIYIYKKRIREEKGCKIQFPNRRWPILIDGGGGET